MFSRKLFALSALLMSVILLNAYDLRAIGEEQPIIALANNTIYAVSPTDGEARVLVERDPDKDALLDKIYAVRRLRLSPISPDNTKFAYTNPIYELLEPAYEEKREEIANLSPRDITLVDIASGELTPVTDQGAHFAEAVESDKVTNFSDLIWSTDGQRLYFLASVLSLRNRVPQRSIEYYDLASGKRQTLVKLGTQAEVIGFYTIHPGIVVLTRSQNSGDFEFTVYGPDGVTLNSIKMPLPASQDCTNGTLFFMNPVFKDDRYYYGYYSHQTDELIPSMLDAALGDSIPLEEGFWPAIISHGAADTSLRLVFDGLCDYQTSNRWYAADADAEPIYWIDLSGVENTDHMGLSPDGQSVAIIRGTERYYASGPIVVMDINGERTLDFEAEQIAWGAVDFTFAQIFHRG